MAISSFDVGIFIVYLVAVVAVGYWKGRGETRSAKHYFLAGSSLPWFAVGLSMIATSISTEQFIGEIGFAYTAGLSVANWELGVYPAFMVLAWILLPLYLSRGMFTIPEYLERRFGRGTRTIFAVITLLNYALINLAGVVYLGGFALNQIFGLPLYTSAIVLALITGGYSIYGGLSSVVWTDVLQAVLLLVGGISLFLFGMNYVGWDPSAILSPDPARGHLIAPLSHPHMPWTMVVILLFSTNVWYCCTNQFYIQRCLGARSLWHGRMGVLLACFLGIFLTLSVCMPGLIAYRIDPHLERADSALVMMVTTVLPKGLHGVIFAALVAAIMSTISSLVNSTATVFSIDIYRGLFRPEVSDAGLVRVGRVSGAVAVVLACLIAPLVALRQNVFLYFQDCWAVLAVPVGVVFILGALWRRATPSAAFATMLLTVLFLPVTFIWRSAEDLAVFAKPGVREIYNLAPWFWNAVHEITRTMHFFTFVCLLWAGTYTFMIAWSLLSKDPKASEHAAQVWRPSILSRLTSGETRPWYQSIGFWSVVLGAVFAVIYIALW